jgi:hypothetical protein
MLFHLCADDNRTSCGARVEDFISGLPDSCLAVRCSLSDFTQGETDVKQTVPNSLHRLSRGCQRKLLSISSYFGTLVYKQTHGIILPVGIHKFSRNLGAAFRLQVPEGRREAVSVLRAHGFGFSCEADCHLVISAQCM